LTRHIAVLMSIRASDAVGQGFIASLAHPGDSVTGFSNVEPEMGGQWLKLLKEIAPRVTEVGILGADTLGGGVEIEAAIQKIVQDERG
jgi:putative tryptophan/tyrosine transport system substrate-binding protein